MEQLHTTSGSGDPTSSEAPSAESSSVHAQVWSSPGVSVRKRWLTGCGVALAAALFFWVALAEGASMLVSTVIGVIFIGCFIWYLAIVAPTPFTVTLDAHGVTRAEAGAEAATIPWAGVAKVKEETFKNGTSVSLTVYKRVGDRGLHRAWVVYRDDISRFDSLVTALQAGLPEATPWLRETVHD